MNIFIDADASPVIKETCLIAQKYEIRVYIVKSYAHYSYSEIEDYAETIYVDSGKDAADLAIIKHCNRGDIVITQDYGLASICLGKGCYVVHHKGFLFTNKNIDRLLAIRHENAKLRRAGKRTKGPRPYSEEEREKFIKGLKNVISSILTEE